MSFFTLLILLSLIIVVPVFFVMKEKSKQAQIDSTQRHQEYLVSASKSASVLETENALRNSDDSTNNSNVISFSSNHPFVRQLYDERVPQTFRAIMDEIGQQYECTHHEQITESQLFTLNKLIATRIPELIGDYLSLDQNYAQTVIIDTDKAATSYTMVLEQLHSILDFAQKLNIQSQSGVVDKLLASRRYLDEVYQDSGLINDDLKIKRGL